MVCRAFSEHGSNSGIEREISMITTLRMRNRDRRKMQQFQAACFWGTALSFKAYSTCARLVQLEGVVTSDGMEVEPTDNYEMVCVVLVGGLQRVQLVTVALDTRRAVVKGVDVGGRIFLLCFMIDRISIPE